MREIRPVGAIYKNVTCVGQGQTATVFRAIREDSEGHSQQTVALKILKSRTAVSWLRREFEALVKISSPHCVKVLGWENLDEGCALVLEWIDGVTLLEFGESIDCAGLVEEIVAQVQDGLRALRAADLFHGDLSPSNILIDRQGMVRIVDFALAPSEPGIINGTPAYLAPEIWQGQPPSFKSDLFALGLIANDVRTGFFSTPKTQDACRERAFKTEGEVSLLNPDPSLRCPLYLQSRVDLKRRLAVGVRELLDKKASLVARTQALSVIASPEVMMTQQARWALPKVACLLLVGMMTMAASVQAQAPLTGFDRTEHEASLCIRTQKWFEVSLNGKIAGYTPLCIQGIKPGPHKLTWQNGKGSAGARLTLGTNENLQLNQSQLESLGNR